MNIKEKISDYFDGIVEIKITSKEQMDHDKLVRRIRHNRICLINHETKKIKGLLNEER